MDKEESKDKELEKRIEELENNVKKLQEYIAVIKDIFKGIEYETSNAIYKLSD